MRFPSFSRPRRSFKLLLVVITGALIFQMATPDDEGTRLVTIALQGLVVLVSLSVAGADPRLMRAAGVALTALVTLSAITLVGFGGVTPAIPRIITLMLVLLAPIGLAAGLRRELREDGRVTLETVYGGLCLYLLIGLAFAFAFSVIEDVGNKAFFSGGDFGSPNDFLYFSLSTLTTTGYGDLTAGTGAGRSLAVTEALLGQIYLVTVVALLVSNLGRDSSGRLDPQVMARLEGAPMPQDPPEPSGSEPGPGPEPGTGPGPRGLSP